MRAVIQRVTSASVTIDSRQTAKIGKGIVVFLGIKQSDSEKEIIWMTEKLINLRIFPDEEDKMNHSLSDIDGEMLIVSQFTLYGDCRKGRRPGYSSAASPEIAKPIYNRFIKHIGQTKIRSAYGTFQAMMNVALVNDGPVTLLLDSEKNF